MANILLVDDDKEVLNRHSEVLVLEKHNVTPAAGGMEALRLMKLDNYDLLLTKLDLNRMTGDKLLEIILDSQGALPFPVIFTTSQVNNDIIKKFAANSLVHFLPKPISDQQLKDKVKEVLANPIAKTKLDVRFINPVLNATIEVIAEMTSLKISAAKPYLKRPGESSGDISGVVGVISSGFRGTISLSLSEKAFLALISKMLGEKYTAIDDENKDAIAELLNIIFGAAKKILNEEGMNIQPAIPTIVRGKNHSLSHHAQSQTIVIPFTNAEMGDFRAEVCSMS